MSVQELIDALMKIEDKSRPVYIFVEPEDHYYMTLDSITEPWTPWVLDDDGGWDAADDSTPGAFYPVLLEYR